MSKGHNKDGFTKRKDTTRCRKREKIANIVEYLKDCKLKPHQISLIIGLIKEGKDVDALSVSESFGVKATQELDMLIESI